MGYEMVLKLSYITERLWIGLPKFKKEENKGTSSIFRLFLYQKTVNRMRPSLSNTLKY